MLKIEISLLLALSNRLLTVSCFFLLLGILLFGLWPFWYAPPNHAEITESPGAIHFQRNGEQTKLDAGGLAYTPQPLTWQNSHRSNAGSLTLEISARPSSRFKWGLGLLVALCDQNDTIKLLLAQWKSHLVIRTFFFPSERGPYTEIGLKDTLIHDQTSFITVTSDERKTVLYVNGQMKREVANISLLPGNGDLSGYRLYFGNDLSLAHPWSGELHGFALYDRALTPAEAATSFMQWSNAVHSLSMDRSEAIVRYVFDTGISHEEGMTIRDSADGHNPLLVPAAIPFKKPLLEHSPLRSNGTMDIIVNLLGFIPFGFFFAFWFSQVARRSPFWSCAAAVLCGFLASLFIEVHQSFMPTRSSTLNDLICNTVGTILGVVLFRCAHSTSRRLSSPTSTAEMPAAQLPAKTP